MRTKSQGGKQERANSARSSGIPDATSTSRAFLPRGIATPYSRNQKPMSRSRATRVADPPRHLAHKPVSCPARQRRATRGSTVRTPEQEGQRMSDEASPRASVIANGSQYCIRLVRKGSRQADQPRMRLVVEQPSFQVLSAVASWRFLPSSQSETPASTRQKKVAICLRRRLDVEQSLRGCVPNVGLRLRKLPSLVVPMFDPRQPSFPHVLLGVLARSLEVPCCRGREKFRNR